MMLSSEERAKIRPFDSFWECTGLEQHPLSMFVEVKGNYCRCPSEQHDQSFQAHLPSKAIKPKE